MHYFLSESRGFINLSEGQIPAWDRGFLFGEGLFESMVAYGQKILNLYSHLNRLRDSAAQFDLDFPWPNELIEFEIIELCRQIHSEKKYIKLIITGGYGSSLANRASEPKRYLLGGPSPNSIDLYNRGIALRRVSHPSPPTQTRHKTTNYLVESTALARARREGFDEILWTGRDGEITECATANIFFIARQGDSIEFVTPPTTAGILPGITRNTVIRLLEAQGIPVEEKAIFSEELARFDEAFICSAIRGVMPVSQINQQRLYTRRPQATFRLVENLYSLWLNEETGSSVTWKV
jgi:branched-chain amino acid aminotransferase